MKRRLKNISKIVIPAVIVIFVVLIFFLVPRLIKIAKIECESQYGVCPEEAQLAISNLQFTNLSEAKKQVKNSLKDNLLISDYSMQYAFPDKLKISILLKKARFAVYNKDSGEYLLVGGNGQVLGSTDSTSLPTVVQSGDTPNLLALSLMEGVFAMYQIGEGEIVSDSLVVELPSGKRVIFPLGEDKDKEVLLGSLRLIFSNVQDKEIDLRFKNPVLR